MSYLKIFLEQGPEAALKEAFDREQRSLRSIGMPRRFFTWVRTYAVHRQVMNGEQFVQSYGSYQYVNELALLGREYLVTLHDYKPGIEFIDVAHDLRLCRPRRFESDAERDLIQQHARLKYAEFCEAMKRPFNGVL